MGIIHIGVSKEKSDKEKRVAATPETVKKIIESGLQVLIESEAGKASSISDKEYEKAGATLVPDARSLFQKADITFSVQKPPVDLLKEGSVVIALLQPLTDLDLVRQLASRKITSFSMEMIPRIARAQKLDALSSQSNVAGYKAVLMAANAFGKMFPMMMTAAGTIFPAKVLVIGAGVAGLQAIATAHRLGAVVEVYDTRPIVKEQVESLGAKFVQLELSVKETETKAGYAKELSIEDQEKVKELIAKHVKQSDVVITTAAIPGKPSPKIITEEMVKSMKPGSVIVDLASEGGGNCTITEPGEEVEKHGVKILGQLNVPSLMAAQSSQLYARNVAALLFEFVKEGKLHFNLEDEVIKGALITHLGEVVHPTIKELLKK